MTTIFGLRSSFATEFSLAEVSGGAWMFGHFRYWCGGQEVGDFNVDTSLCDVLFMLEQMRRDVQ